MTKEIVKIQYPHGGSRIYLEAEAPTKERKLLVDTHGKKEFADYILGCIKKWFSQKEGKPKIICICGSTRFADLHAIARWEFEKDGKAICLMINYLPGWYAEEQGWNGNDHFGEQSGNKNALDELHNRKIDMCDELYVINHEGYIGESTRNEIEYAESIDRPIKYKENHPAKYRQSVGL